MVRVREAVDDYCTLPQEELVVRVDRTGVLDEAMEAVDAIGRQRSPLPEVEEVDETEEEDMTACDLERLMGVTFGTASNSS